MNAFIAQLNQLLASADEDNWLAGLCDLLRTHMAAHVCIYAHDGKMIAESLPLNGTRPGKDAHTLSMPIPLGAAFITITRGAVPFSEAENDIVNIAICICTLLLNQRVQQAETRRIQRHEVVRSAINALSFSELEAAIHIVQSLGGYEGRLVAGHTADKLGFTRSVVVNALKKLEGAGVIETRSLGVKGTHIRITNQVLVDELNKL